MKMTLDNIAEFEKLADVIRAAKPKSTRPVVYYYPKIGDTVKLIREVPGVTVPVGTVLTVMGYSLGSDVINPAVVFPSIMTQLQNGIQGIVPFSCIEPLVDPFDL